MLVYDDVDVESAADENSHLAVAILQPVGVLLDAVLQAEVCSFWG